jgi:hypothetical protein
VSVLRAHGYPAWPADLLVSELVNKVVTQAQAPFVVAVSFLGVARVTVFDREGVFPALSEMGDDPEGGRGMFLVQALAHRWGVDHHPTGKQVWFEVSRDDLTG